jgi:hypothetical protein
LFGLHEDPVHSKFNGSAAIKRLKMQYSYILLQLVQKKEVKHSVYGTTLERQPECFAHLTIFALGPTVHDPVEFYSNFAIFSRSLN